VLLPRILSVIAASYAIGCVAGAFYIMRLVQGRDIRSLGSGTAGAHNVLRVGGRGPAIATFLFDVTKGAAAVILGQAILTVAWAGPLALGGLVVGHIWPAQLGFRGGKGLAPALGAMLAISPLGVLLATVAGVALGFARRSVTIGALATVACTAPAALLAGEPLSSAAIIGATMALILIAHHPVFARIRPPLAA